MSGGTIKSGNLQVGQDGTASNNFTWYQPAVADGTVRLGVGVAGATTSDIMTVNSSGVTVVGQINQTVKGSNTNTAFGTSALNANTSGTSLTAIGDRALYSNTANNNNALGSLAGYSNTTGIENSFFGRAAGFANTTGSYNTAVGNLALNANTTGINNTAVGLQAYYNGTTQNNNTAIGYQALFTSNGGAGNTSLGSQSTYSLTSGNNNTVIGYYAGVPITTGSSNTLLGYGTGANLTTGSGSVYIGAYATASSGGASSELVLSANTITVTGKGTSTGFINVGGSIYQGNNSAAWAITSDQRIKKNIMPLTGSLDKIVALNPVEFDYKENDKHEIGFIAQEFETVFPDQIITHEPNEAEKEWVGEDKVKAIQQNLVPYLVKAIQELKAEIDALKGAK